MKSIHPVNTIISLSMASILFLGLTACGSDSGSPAQQSVGLSNFQSAAVVIGQADFTGTGSNQGSAVADANTIFIPSGNVAVSDTGVLYLSDSGNNRLLGFDSVPTVNNQTASFALGQSDFVSTTSGFTASTLFGPQQVILENGQMFLVDYNNDRILIWNTIPASGGVGTDVAADVVLGQSDLVSSPVAGCSASKFNNLESVSVKGGRIFATDTGNNRVLIWSSIPTTNGAAANIVLGQQSFTNCASNDSNDDDVTDLDASLEPIATSSTLDSPAGVWSDGSRIVVLDSDNNRALIWNTFPGANFTPADVVLGQSDFSHVTWNDDDQNNTDDGVASARTMNSPYLGVYSDNIRLFITDTNNSRLLVWNQFPLENFTPADVVLGQSNFTGTAPNADGSASARTLNFPGGVFQSGDKLIVTDSSNHRYLIFNDPR